MLLTWDTQLFFRIMEYFDAWKIKITLSKVVFSKSLKSPLSGTNYAPHPLSSDRIIDDYSDGDFRLDIHSCRPKRNNFNNFQSMPCL